MWNGKPVVVYHPSLYGSPVSTADPEVFNHQTVGTIFNAKVEGSKLKAEAWIDPEAVKRVDTRLLRSITKREVVEVSTGLFTDNAAEPGTWNEEQFRYVARNHRPYHLAILPDQIGACSVADGAGLCRNLSAGSEPLGLPNWGWETVTV